MISDGQKSFVYKCADGTQLTATFVGMSSARLQFADMTVVLPLRLSASGSRYADDRITFWIRGNAAMLTRGDRTVKCVTAPE